MTTKRFRSGLAKNDEFSDEIIDELTGKHYFDSTKDDYVFSEEIVDLLNELHKKNEKLQKAVDNCQFRTLDLLDYIKEKEIVTHQEIKDWWNSEVME